MAGQTVEVALSDPGPSATFPIPATIVPFVDSVYAEIDNGAGSDATPTLEIRGPNGDTVAAVPQDDVVPGGDTGRATWALRLPGKRRRGGGGVSTAYVTATLGSLDPAESIAAGSSNFVGYPHVTISDATVFSFTTSGPFTDSLLHVAKAGVVAMRSIVYWSAGNFPRYAVFDTFNPLSAGGSPDSELSTVNPFGLGPLATKDVAVGHAQAGDLIAVRAFNGDAVARSVTQADLEVIWIG